MNPLPRLFLLVGLAALLSPVLSNAQADPEADKVLDRFVEAIGGDKAIRALKSREMKAEMAMPAAGMKVEIGILQKAPDLYVSEQTVPGMGRMMQGYDGETAWSFNPMQGYRELTGAERAQVLLSADLQHEARLKDKFPERERLADLTEEGKTLQVVKVSGGEVPESTLFFDAGTGLLERMDMIVEGGPQGAMPVSMTFEDYRKVDNVLVPHRVVTQGGPMEMILTTTMLKHNGDIPDSRFTPRKE